MECESWTIFVVALLTISGSPCDSEQRFRKVIVRSVAFRLADHEYNDGEAILSTCRLMHKATIDETHGHDRNDSPINCPNVIRDNTYSDTPDVSNNQDGIVDERKKKKKQKKPDRKKHANTLDKIIKDKLHLQNITDESRQPVIEKDGNTAGITHPEPVSNTVQESNISGNTANEIVAENEDNPVPPISAYIVGGTYVRKERKPWQASIQFVGTDENWHHFCGAALLNSGWIVTAAHCVSNLKEYIIRIVLGDFILGSASGREQYVNPERMLIHEYFDNSSLQHDIALVKLAELVDINDNVYSITMATESESFGSNDECYITGWGVTDGSTDVVSNILRESEMTVITDHECRQHYGNNVTDTQLCVVSQEASACRGDSGGALACRDDGDGWVQAGIASYVISPECAPSYPSTYTRVSSYNEWIEAVIDQVERNTENHM